MSVDYMHILPFDLMIYGRMCNNSTPSLVSRVKMCSHRCDCGECTLPWRLATLCMLLSWQQPLGPAEVTSPLHTGCQSAFPGRTYPAVHVWVSEGRVKQSFYRWYTERLVFNVILPVTRLQCTCFLSSFGYESGRDMLQVNLLFRACQQLA